MEKRHIIRQSDIDCILKLYKNGRSITTISAFMELKESAVKDIIKRDLGEYTNVHQDKHKKFKKKPLKSEIDKRNMIDLYKKGKTIKEIASIIGTIDTYVESILVGANLINPLSYDKRVSGFVTADDLRIFRNYIVKENQTYVVKQEIVDDYGTVKSKRVTAKVLKKYPHIVLTDKGCYQYIDLYINKKLINQSTSK